MKILKTIVLAAMMLTSALAAQAGPVSGHFRSNGTYVAPYHRSDSGSARRSTGSSRGYVYRNPYAAYPSVHVRGYYRSTGTYVCPHVRTAPNHTVTDNLSYRGYGTIRVPRYSLGR
jgi:opacity protein-like surface antigen